MNYLLHHGLFATARHSPDREAFVCGAEYASYGMMVKRVDQLAAVLIDRGVRPGDRVGIYLHRCVETAVAIFGVSRVGAIYVPLNPKAPAARNAYVIADCDISLVISHPAQRRGLQALFRAGAQVQSLIGASVDSHAVKCVDWDAVYAVPAGNVPAIRRVAFDPAYIIYTSGSTGKPKGIVHSHASGLAFAFNAIDRYGFTADDRFGNHAPIYFDVSQLAYFAAPLLGATAVIATDAETVFPASLGKMMERERVSVWYSVPLALVQLLNSGIADTLDLTQLSHVFYAGEPLAPKYARALLGLLPGITLGNWYGPAETNVCTCYDLPGPPVGDDPIPLGDVWANTDRLIVDADNREVPPGEVGELLIRAGTQMLGYWKRPDRSANAWFSPPSVGLPPRRFYRTGDLVREGEDGLLHFLGRADHQVKVRGYRVELAAIERLLASHVAVREACVVALPGGRDESLLLRAVVVVTSPETITGKALIEYLRADLPWYALPETVTLFTTLPRTPTGKTDRTALATDLLAYFSTPGATPPSKTK